MCRVYRRALDGVCSAGSQVFRSRTKAAKTRLARTKPSADGRSRGRKPGYIWGSQPGVFAESPNRIFLAARGELKLPATTAARLQRHLGIAQRTRHRAQSRDAQLHRRRRRQRQADRGVDAVGQAVRGRRRPAQDPDQPVRSAAARLGGQRRAPPDLRVHQRRQATGADARRERRRRQRRQAFRPAAGHRRGCPTARSSSPTVSATRAS